LFTGLIEELGRVRRRVRRGAFQQLEVEAERVLDGLQVGDSVNIDGVCQTVVAIGERGFAVETVAETLSRTTLGTLGIGRAVNLERALGADQRLGGHLVLGHVDGIARIRQRTERDREHHFELEVPPALARYIAAKGSVALDGISLTVAEASGDVFTIAVIPHTFDNTTLSHRRTGDSVNLEVDVIARYVERLLGGQSQFTFEDLRDMGY